MMMGTSYASEFSFHDLWNLGNIFKTNVNTHRTGLQKSMI